MKSDVPWIAILVAAVIFFVTFGLAGAFGTEIVLSILQTTGAWAAVLLPPAAVMAGVWAVAVFYRKILRL